MSLEWRCMRVDDRTTGVAQRLLTSTNREVKHGRYPSETFRVLKEGELRTYGEYRTRRLVLEAWDPRHPVRLRQPGAGQV